MKGVKYKTMKISEVIEGYFNYSVHTRIDRNGYLLSYIWFGGKRNIPIKDRTKFYKRIHSNGICLFCPEIDFSVLEEHHPYPEKLPDFTITLCANCHARLHWYLGNRKGDKKEWLNINLKR